MPSTRLRAIGHVALAWCALGAALAASSGCYSWRVSHSNFVSVDAAPPVRAVPESCYWSLPVAVAWPQEESEILDEPRWPGVAPPPEEVPLPGATPRHEEIPPPAAVRPIAFTQPGYDTAYSSAVANFAAEPEPAPNFFKRSFDEVYLFGSCIWQDHKNYYSRDNLGLLCIGFAAGALVANTSWDRELRDWYQGEVRSEPTDQFSEVCKSFGEGTFLISVVGSSWLAGQLFHETPCGCILSEWSSRSVRTALVGTPSLILMQYVTGGSRPVETDNGDWQPFSDNNGVSGHAFVGAIPFICAAQMTDELAPKIIWYGCSILPAWSRVNDNAHYTSQSFLGWWIAYCAATAVDVTYQREREWTVTPLPMAGGVGMLISYQY